MVLHLGALRGSFFKVICISDSHRPNATKQAFDLNFPTGKSLQTLTLQIFLLSGTPKQQFFNGCFNWEIIGNHRTYPLNTCSLKAPSIESSRFLAWQHILLKVAVTLNISTLR